MKTKFFLILAFLVADSLAADARPFRRRITQQPVEQIVPSDQQVAIVQDGAVAGEAIDEVNAARAAKGLRPFIHDPELTKGAQACANARAARLCEGHTSNDFNYLPSGASARAGGCAAWGPNDGWGSCCTYENYTYAGAAWAIGRDGRRYMQLFVR